MEMLPKKHRDQVMKMSAFAESKQDGEVASLTKPQGSTGRKDPNMSVNLDAASMLTQNATIKEPQLKEVTFMAELTIW